MSFLLSRQEEVVAAASHSLLLPQSAGLSCLHCIMWGCSSQCCYFIHMLILIPKCLQALQVALDEHSMRKTVNGLVNEIA